MMSLGRVLEHENVSLEIKEPCQKHIEDSIKGHQSAKAKVF